MSFTNYLAQAVLNSIFGKTSALGALASAPTIWVGLSSTAPTEAGGNITEPSGGGYARVQTVAADWAAATSADPSVIANAETIDFGTASGNWLSLTPLAYVFFASASSGGNVLAFGALAASKPVASGDPVYFDPGDLSVSLD